jgi:hypothetical protein
MAPNASRSKTFFGAPERGDIHLDWPCPEDSGTAFCALEELFSDFR